MVLNEAQQRAVAHQGGHALVLAGAGTGKTATLIARAVELLQRGVRPDQIILVTFTRRATRELRERLTHQVGEVAERMRVGTFHRICLDLMRLEPDAFELRSYTIIDEDDREQLMRLARGRVLPNDDGDRGSALPKASQLVTWLSYARNANIPVKQYLETQKLFDEQQLANVLAVYTTYEDRKTAAHYLDFDDILRRCATVLISRREVRERIVGRIQHVLVDEIQDTSTLQWQLLHALRQKASLFCVGDDAQSIYAFRGADFKTVHSFAERVKGADVYYLTQNYRSTQEILDVSNWLLAESPLRYNKELQAIRGHATKPLLVECDDDLAQGLWVAADMDHRHANGTAWSSMVVLVRTAFAARTVETACIERGIPYIFVGGTSLLKASHVRDILALLRVVLNLNDEVAWMRYLTLWKGVGDRTAERWVQQVGACESLQQAAEFLYRAKPDPKGPAMPLLHILEHTATPATQVLAAVQALDPLLAVKYQYEQWEQRKKDLELLVRIANRFGTLAAFVEEFVLDPLHASQVAPQDDAVTVSTVHAAKGTEAEVVYLARADVGQYPHSHARDDDEIEEERRVLYVALTRARDELIVLRSPEQVASWGAQYSFLDTLRADLVTLVESGSRRREAWKTLSSLDGVVPDIDDMD